jgi:hypothetical protein
MEFHDEASKTIREESGSNVSKLFRRSVELLKSSFISNSIRASIQLSVVGGSFLISSKVFVI